MRILAFETTCDETSVCVMDGGRVLSNVIFSQIPLHRKYNGVVPELASRAHLENIFRVLGAALSRAGYRRPFLNAGRWKGPKIDAVVFSRGPGLPGALLVSRVVAEAASRLLGAELLGVNHLEGHFLACEFSGARASAKIRFPCVALIVSGGHTELWKAADYGRYETLGRTRDGMVEVLTGLAPGEPVVLRPDLEVEDGRPVEVR